MPWDDLIEKFIKMLHKAPRDALTWLDRAGRVKDGIFSVFAPWSRSRVNIWLVTVEAVGTGQWEQHKGTARAIINQKITIGANGQERHHQDWYWLVPNIPKSAPDINRVLDPAACVEIITSWFSAAQ